MRKLFPNATEEQVNNKTLLFQRSVNQANALHHELNTKQSLRQLYSVKGNFRALISACGLMAAQQLCGFNTLMYYSATLFAIVGFKNPIAVGSVVAITNFVFGGVSLKWADKIGRRRILIATMWAMSVALAIVAVAFRFIPINLSTLALETDNAGWAGVLVLVMIVVFVAFYASGLGCIPWTANELLPMEVRAVGTMMITCTCWGMNIIISSTFLSMMKGMTPSGAFGFYAGINLLGWLFVIFFYPEVAGMPLEEVRTLFVDDFGVKKARQWRKDNAAWLKEQRRHGAVLGA